MSRVAVIACSEYASAYEAVVRAVEVLGGASAVFKGAKNILVKPNLLKASPPEKCIVTNPAVVGAAARLASDAGATPIVGDSPAWGAAQFVARTARYDEEPALTGVEIVDFDRGRSIATNNLVGLGSATLSHHALDCDMIVNVPKFKTHVQMVMSGSVKNLFGCVVGKRKPLYHCLVKDSKLMFAHMLLDIVEALPRELVIVDGIMAMEGDGPMDGRSRKMGVIIAGTDPISVDAVMARLAGFQIEEVPVLAAAKERGYRVELRDIELVGDSIDRFMRGDYLRPELENISFAPHRVLLSTIKGFFLKMKR